jgi:hypothetical protein
VELSFFGQRRPRPEPEPPRAPELSAAAHQALVELGREQKRRAFVRWLIARGRLNEGYRDRPAR